MVGGVDWSDPVVLGIVGVGLIVGAMALRG